jgi:hypothetical protein
LDVAYFTRVLQVFYLDVAYASQWLFMCFRVFLQVFQMHVSNVSSSSDYVASVASEYFKSRFGVTHIAIAPVAGGQQPAVELWLLPCAARLALPFLPFPPSRLGVGIGVGVIEFAAFERRR